MGFFHGDFRLFLVADFTRQGCGSQIGAVCRLSGRKPRRKRKHVGSRYVHGEIALCQRLRLSYQYSVFIDPPRHRASMCRCASACGIACTIRRFLGFHLSNSFARQRKTIAWFSVKIQERQLGHLGRVVLDAANMVPAAVVILGLTSSALSNNRVFPYGSEGLRGCCRLSSRPILAAALLN